MYPVSQQFLDTVKESHVSIAKAEILDKNGNVVLADLPVTQGYIRIDSKADNRRTANAIIGPVSEELLEWVLSYKGGVIESDPIGYWRLGETSGTVAADSSGNGRDGTYQGSPTLGVPGALVADDDTAVDFVGASYVSLGTDIRATPGSGSFECWVDTTQWADTAGHGLYQNVSSWDNSANSIALFRYPHSVSNDAQFYFRIVNPSGTIQDLASQWRNFFGTLDGWHHVAGTWDATYMRLYIDGVEVTSRTYTPPNALRTDTQISRGHDQPGNGHELDEPALYDRALTAAEVKQHYDIGIRVKPRMPRGALGEWYLTGWNYPMVPEDMSHPLAPGINEFRLYRGVRLLAGDQAGQALLVTYTLDADWNSGTHDWTKAVTDDLVLEF